ncbi:MAG: hypothetical protein KDA63_14335 [Planctomycetales bacterium]|nr:hypothetical protein [Planctomycetales bacterium]
MHNHLPPCPPRAAVLHHRAGPWPVGRIAARALTLVAIVVAGVAVHVCDAHAQATYEVAPINYYEQTTDDPVELLLQRIASGEAQLEFDESRGYLPALLAELKVPTSSQVLVFSKTSLQLQKISPGRPRALYFNDDVYVGWVQRSNIVEVAAVSPQQGTIFYTLKNTRRDTPQIVRDRGDCLVCHAGALTGNVPGLMVRSVFPDATGQPILGAGTYRTDHTSPLEQRWGGWYITGQHGEQRHMGNQFFDESADPRQEDLARGANVVDLSDHFDTSSYLSPHSDAAALMVLEHQAEAHNLLTRASYDARIALRDARVVNEMLGRPADHISESIEKRLTNAAERTLRYLLFCDEATWNAPISGTSTFAEEFSARGPFDQQGRSLHQLDLERRLLKYPCSYLIYSEQFTSLPDALKLRMYDRLKTILDGDDTSGDYDHLTAADRQAIRQILIETVPDLPEDWRSEG